MYIIKLIRTVLKKINYNTLYYCFQVTQIGSSAFHEAQPQTKSFCYEHFLLKSETDVKYVKGFYLLYYNIKLQFYYSGCCKLNMLEILKKKRNHFPTFICDVTFAVLFRLILPHQKTCIEGSIEIVILGLQQWENCCLSSFLVSRLTLFVTRISATQKKTMTMLGPFRCNIYCSLLFSG